MGAGSWSEKDFISYSCSVGRSVFDDGVVDLKANSVYQNFKQNYCKEAQFWPRFLATGHIFLIPPI